MRQGGARNGGRFLKTLTITPITVYVGASVSHRTETRTMTPS